MGQIRVRFIKEQNPQAEGTRVERVAVLDPYGKELRVENPKQGFLPHDMVQYVIEKVFPVDGVLRHLARGITPNSTPAIGGEFWQSDALTNALAAEATAARPSDAGFRSAVLLSCEARKVPPYVPDVVRMEEARVLLRVLQSQWQALPPGGMLELILEELEEEF